jgi:ribosomal protein S18 acetylase RimI-like enzyme
VDVLLRELRPEDREAIFRLLTETGVFRPEEIDVALELVDAVLQKPDQRDYTFSVAECAGAVVGYACWGATPCTRGTWDLYWMAASPAFHGKGLAARLLTQAEEDMAARGCRLCVIETSSLPPYEAARRFYLKHGYLETARIPDFYGPGDARIIYTRRLKDG